MTKPTAQNVLKSLRELARVASVVVDGDEAGRIMTDRAAEYAANPDPEHRWLAMDYYVVDQARFLRMKKLLARLACLPEFPCSTALWLKLGGGEGWVTPVVLSGTLSRYYQFGEGRYKPEMAMVECLSTGRAVEPPLNGGGPVLTVLAPVFDSLGETVGLVELSALNPQSKTMPPAWS